MKATAIKLYRCVCIECEPLPPIEGLHPLTYGDADNEARKPKGFLGFIPERLLAPRRQEQR